MAWRSGPRVAIINGTRFQIVGARRTPFRDGYHAFLRASWPGAIASLVVGYLLVNVVFAVAYWLAGGVANSSGTLREMFYFSVHTLGTIGYGSMYPESDAANLLVVAESVTGMLTTALATGLVFAKFGRTSARVVFSRNATIGPHDGVPTLMLRVGNERDNQLLDVHYRVGFGRTERSREGVLYYRQYELPLARAHATSLRSAFTLMHVVDANSPLHGYDAARLEAEEGELYVTVSGLDDTTMQPVHATCTYDGATIVFGARPADVLTQLPDGTIQVDLGHFHEVVRDEARETEG